MELLVFGHAGARVVAFPTSAGAFHDWEDRGLVGALADPLEKGWIQLTCVDSVDRESWYAYGKHPAERAARHAAFDRYVADEVLPFTRTLNSNPFLIVTGASFGGYHAANFAFRHPDQVGRMISMSGIMDVRRFTNGYYDDTVYFNNPIDYLANEQDPRRLDAIRRMDIILAVGRDDGLRASNEQMSGILWGKGVWHALRIWDGFAHDWPVWADMLRLYLPGHD